MKYVWLLMAINDISNIIINVCVKANIIIIINVVILLLLLM